MFFKEIVKQAESGHVLLQLFISIPETDEIPFNTIHECVNASQLQEELQNTNFIKIIDFHNYV